MSYYRQRFSSFEEFQREALRDNRAELGKDEYELLDELEAEDECLYQPRSRRSSWLD